MSDLLTGETGGRGAKNDFWATEWIVVRCTEFSRDMEGNSRYEAAIRSHIPRNLQVGPIGTGVRIMGFREKRPGGW